MLILLRMLSLSVNKLYLIFVMGIFWFHNILKRIQFAGRLTLDSATCHECKGKNLHFASKRCEMWEVPSLFSFIVELLVREHGSEFRFT